MLSMFLPKWRWLVVEIYQAAKRQRKYLPLGTDTEGGNCFSIKLAGDTRTYDVIRLKK